MPLSDTEKTIIAESIGESEEGMFWVSSVIVNRGRVRNLSTDQVVAQPNQFAGFARPDLDDFVSRQSQEKVGQAQAAFRRALEQPQEGIMNFLTTELYDDLDRRPSWANRLKVKRRIGRHVFLGE